MSSTDSFRASLRDEITDTEIQVKRCDRKVTIYWWFLTISRIVTVIATTAEILFKTNTDYQLYSTYTLMLVAVMNGCETVFDISTKTSNYIAGSWGFVFLIEKLVVELNNPCVSIEDRTNFLEEIRDQKMTLYQKTDQYSAEAVLGSINRDLKHVSVQVPPTETTTLLH